MYFIVHILCEVFALLYAYTFLALGHNLTFATYFFVLFAVFDFIQAVLPSKGKTESIHFAAAYISWFAYQIAGVIMLFGLGLSRGYQVMAATALAPVIAMFFYMHINRSKLYPYQLLMVPLFVLSVVLMTLGAR